MESSERIFFSKLISYFNVYLLDLSESDIHAIQCVFVLIK